MQGRWESVEVFKKKNETKDYVHEFQGLFGKLDFSGSVIFVRRHF